MAQAIILLRGQTIFDLDFVETEEPETVDYHKQKKGPNPYAS